MTVAFDAPSTSGPGTGNLSWTHTPTGTPKGVVVFVVEGNDGITTPTVDGVSGVTYGGTTMTEMTGSPNTHFTGATDAAVVHGFFLGSSVPSGAQTIAVTVGTSTSKIAAAYTVTAGADTEIVDVDATINSTSLANPSVTLSLASRSCFCAIGFASGVSVTTSITPFTNWTGQIETDFGNDTGGSYTYDIIGTTDVSAGWTQAADDATMIAVAVAEVAAATALKDIIGGTGIIPFAR